MPLRSSLLEEHWSYMDGFSLIARGPTFADGVLTGSVHVVDVPDAAAARAFAFEEPVYQAGGYRDVLVRRWRNVLGRTMWDFAGGREGGGHLVLGFGAGEAVDLVPARPEELVAYGPLLSDDGTAWLGTAPRGWGRRRWSGRRTRRRCSRPVGTTPSRSTSGSSAAGARSGPATPRG
ncbi:YciI family protein [Lentzea sp. NEAU-D7]|uniref:YciI family protein n=1 Tax=Lentzea sp. NEAU-D7 TaxID=2994667 RepID=UPI00224B3012|nr:YciI family protein [Lentzea sp. NEAU-D7]MCX2947514.1 YciI family protein [Lentzea sp. NEAU-D7]